MGNQNYKIIIGVSVGLSVGILIGCGSFLLIRFYRKRSRFRAISTPVLVNGINAATDSIASISVSETDHDLYDMAKRNTYRAGHQTRDLVTSASGIPRYSYKDIEKATLNFTTVLGQGSFGPVYKATMPTSEVVAVKVLGDSSRQGEREFQTEVALLSRLHHRNLVNLVGYCIDKNYRMLIYEFMSNGNLASHLYDDGARTLSWEERLQIAFDISHGIEYLHDGAVPPVIHRDLKSANILLDKRMRAKVADFGLSREDVFDGRKSGLKGTYGYMDPDYMKTNKSTKKSDIYSFGIILFELITAIHPQQGLMEYINLAAIGGDGKADWDEILDKKLAGESRVDEVKLLADIAYKCLHKIPRKRPSIGDLTLAISRVRNRHLAKDDPLPRLDRHDSGFLRRIESQHVELSKMTSMRSYSHIEV